MHVGLKEGDEVGSGLGDNVMVDVEEFRYALQRRLAVRVRGVAPVPEVVDRVGLIPGNDAAIGVFTEDGCFAVAVESGGGGVGGYGCCPD